MNFQQNSPQKSSDTSTFRSLQNSGPGYAWDHFKSNSFCLYGRDPTIYWKSNYSLAKQPTFHNSLDFSLMEDSIEVYLLRQHKQVIFQQILELQQYIAEEKSFSFGVLQTGNQISEVQVYHLFFQELLEVETFSALEAQQFKEILLKRDDWRKLFFKLSVYFDKRLLWQFTYIFYISLKFIQEHHQINSDFNHLENILDQYLNINSIDLKTKMQHLGFSDNFGLHVKIFMFTIISALHGIYENKYFNGNNAKNLYDSEVITKNQESSRQKRIKVLNARQKQQDVEEIQVPPKKKVKILLS